VDVSLVPEQTFNDPNPSTCGNHAMALSDDGSPSTSWLLPLTPDQSEKYPDFVADQIGLQNLEDGIDSEAARSVLKCADKIDR
jgi:hypothetical protein